MTVSTSFLGAHALPPEFAGRADEYIDVVAREWLPAIAREGLVDVVDAWCEDIAFTAAQCERVFALWRAPRTAEREARSLALADRLDALAVEATQWVNRSGQAAP